MSVLMLWGSAVVPSLLLFWYVWARDRNPEPHGLLLKTFLLGVLICIPVVPAAMGLQALGEGLAVGMWGSALVKAFLGAAIPEEIFKFLVLRWYVWRKHHFDEPLDGVVYGATASLGFATLENILYVDEYGFSVAVLRAVTAVPGHAFTGVVMGAFVGRARFAAPERRPWLLAAGLGGAILLHGAYDAFLFTDSAYAFLALLVLATEIHWGRRLYKALQAEQVLLRPAFMAQPLAVTPGGALASSPDGLVALNMAEAEAEAEAASARRPVRPERTPGSWLRIGVGGVGLSLCGLWWLGVASVLFLPDTSGEPVSAGGKLGLVLLSAIPTFFFLGLFRSGLRGPFVSAAR